VRGGLRGAERHAPAAPYLVLIKNNSDGNQMKSRSAFEFTVRKMLRQNPKLYFWTFTLREVHSLNAECNCGISSSPFQSEIWDFEACGCWNFTKNTDATFT